MSDSSEVSFYQKCSDFVHHFPILAFNLQQYFSSNTFKQDLNESQTTEIKPEISSMCNYQILVKAQG